MNELILALGGLCGALLGIAAFVRWVGRPVWRVVRSLVAFLEDWNGSPERPGRNRIPSMPERVSDLEHGLAAVEKQVTPNGGNTKTIGDAMVRVERALGTDPEQNGDTHG